MHENCKHAEIVCLLCNLVYSLCLFGQSVHHLCCFHQRWCLGICFHHHKPILYSLYSLKLRELPRWILVEPPHRATNHSLGDPWAGPSLFIDYNLNRTRFYNCSGHTRLPQKTCSLFVHKNTEGRNFSTINVGVDVRLGWFYLITIWPKTAPSTSSVGGRWFHIGPSDWPWQFNHASFIQHIHQPFTPSPMRCCWQRNFLSDPPTRCGRHLSHCYHSKNPVSSRSGQLHMLNGGLYGSSLFTGASYSHSILAAEVATSLHEPVKVRLL